MPDKEATLAASQILEAVERIRAYLAGLDETAFLADGRTRDAVAMNLLVIGENATRLPVDLRRQDTEFDWQDAIALRHRIAHGYESLSFAVIWSIAIVELDGVEIAAERMIARLEGL